MLEFDILLVFESDRTSKSSPANSKIEVKFQLCLRIHFGQLKLEYCIQAWRRYLEKDMDLIEKVQKRVRI